MPVISPANEPTKGVLAYEETTQAASLPDHGRGPGWSGRHIRQRRVRDPTAQRLHPGGGRTRPYSERQRLSPRRQHRSVHL